MNKDKIVTIERNKKTPNQEVEACSSVVGLEDMDLEAFLNMRDWLEGALTQSGAIIEGAGIGGDQADVSFSLEGMRYSVSIRPLPKVMED